MLGRLLSSCAGSAWTSRYSATPIGLFPSRSAYSATTLFLLLQSKRPIVGASCGAFTEATALTYAVELYETILLASSPQQMVTAVDLRMVALKGQTMETLETTP